MAVYAFHIQKEMDYKGVREPFGNTYHYLEGPDDEWGETEFSDLGVAVARLEQAYMPGGVAFTQFTVWGPTDGPENENVIVLTQDLDFNGTQTAVEPTTFRTTAALVYWPIPRSPVHNRRRWLRKFFRPIEGVTADENFWNGTGTIPDDEREQFVDDYVNACRTVATGGGNGELCSEDGAVTTGDGGVRRYATTRQIRS